jgi:hypothetical protein
MSKLQTEINSKKVKKKDQINFSGLKPIPFLDIRLNQNHI